VEPQLGPVDLSAWLRDRTTARRLAANLSAGLGVPHDVRGPRLAFDWVICGGESGPGARAFHLWWARALRDQCRGAGVAYFFKQAGALAIPDHVNDGPIYEYRISGQATGIALKLLNKKGGDIGEIPADLRIRQFPQVSP
jgi:hypothetical protein